MFIKHNHVQYPLLSFTGNEHAQEYIGRVNAKITKFIGFDNSESAKLFKTFFSSHFSCIPICSIDFSACYTSFTNCISDIHSACLSKCCCKDPEEIQYAQVGSRAPSGLDEPTNKKSIIQ